MTQNNKFMSLYGFAFVISNLRRISFDINGQAKKKNKKKKKKKKKLPTDITSSSSPTSPGHPPPYE